MEKNRYLLSICEASKIYNIGRDKMYSLARTGSIPVVKIGSVIKINRPLFEAFLNDVTNSGRIL